MPPTPNPALFAVTAPSIPSPEAPFGWQLPTIDPTHTPATHLASPHSHETAPLELLSALLQCDGEFQWFAYGVDALLCDAGSLELEPCRVGVDFGIVTGLADVLDTPRPQCHGGDHARN